MAQRRLSAVILAVVVVAIVVLALTHPGVSTARVSLNDGGIWVTNKSQRLVGHLNYPSATLDAGLRASSGDFTLSQYESDIMVTDKPSSSLYPVDVANVALSQGTGLGGAVAFQGGHMVGVVDRRSGKVFSIPSDKIEQFQPEVAQPAATGFVGGVIATGVDGTVHVASARANKQVSISAKDHQATTTALDVPTDTTLAITAVGDRAVVMDTKKNLVYLPGGQTVHLKATQPTLQQPGPDNSEVFIATQTALVAVDLSHGKIRTIPATTSGTKPVSGTPAQPVYHLGCAYSAWSGSGIFVRDCGSQDNTVTMTAKELQVATQPIFRVNRKIIVLNDIADGKVWLPDRKMMLVDSWDSVTATVEREEDEDDTPDESQEITDPDRDDTNRPPQAVDDSFGVRPGRSAMLPVLHNDNDPDGDVLVATPVSDPDFGRVKQVRGGAMLQIDIPDGASGSTTFTYEASDGRGGTDQATVTITVHPWSHNDSPQQLRSSKVTLGAGAKATYSVLPDWFDPDGDSFYLASATSKDNLDVTFREDGVVSIDDRGVPAGIHTVMLEVSDGKQSAKGIISVDVRAPGNLPPKANGDLIVAKAGEATTIRPLDNDTDPNGDKLMLVSVSAPSGDAGIEPDLTAGTAKFQAATAGSYYMTYVISDGPTTASGLIRVDVVQADKTGAPVAEDDTGMLPPGGQAVIDLTQNDSDPAGNVLVVQAVHVPEGSPLSVALVDQHIARVTAPQGLEGSAVFDYTVSNGMATAQAHVNIIALDRVQADKPPVADSDSAVVRVNDVATVDVLKNDRSPSGLKLRVLSDLDGDVDTALGTAFVSDNTVRFKANNKPGTAHVNYTIVDTQGNKDSAEVSFSVNPMNRDTNSAPRPRDVEARLLAGQTKRIPIPLYDIDDDGDSVQLVSLNSAATQGIAEVSGSTIQYTAGFDAKGTDTFTYTVEDRLGKQAIGQVRIGIAPAPASNQPPVAVNDQVTVRPDRDVAVAVTANDIDPDGDQLVLVSDSVTSADEQLQVEARDGRVAFTAPKKEGTYKATYQVSDERGGVDNGLLTVNVRHDAPLQAPIARDDIISVNDVPAGATEFNVPVLNNDDDPDGDIRSLTVTVDDATASVTPTNQVTVRLTDRRQLIMYTITDQDGLSSSAIIFVPALVGDEVAPRLNPQMIPARVKAGQTLSIPLEKYVIVRNARTPTLTDKSKVNVQLGASTKPLVVSDTQLQYAPPKDFGGTTALTFEVSDGKSRDDAGALTSVLTLPVEVEPVENKMPIFRPTAIEVSADDTPVTVDIAAMVSDPEGVDPHKFTYSLVKDISGLSTSLAGSQLTVKAPGGTPKGAMGQLSIRIVDGDNKVTGSLPVTVVTSSRPTMEIAPAQVEADAGSTIDINVARYITNPFPGKELYIAGTPRVVAGQGRVVASGTTLHITPEITFFGTLDVVYRAGDMTKDTLRERQGTVRLTVSAKPDAPTGVSVQSVGGRTANISWTAGSANGKPITHFTMQEVATGATKQCQGTQCQWDGLTPGEEYSFKVRATNAVGTSPWSAPSTPVLIDTAPDRPSAPTVTAGDRKLHVEWPEVASNGSPVTGYKVTLLGPAGAQTKDVTSRTVVFTGLENGKQYTVTVMATNRAKEPSPASPGTTAIPFGKPGQPGTPTASVNSQDSTGTQAPVTVTWRPPADNGGRTITGYLVTSSTGEDVRTHATTSATFHVPVGKKVSFTVQAISDGGTSAPAVSNVVTVKGLPTKATVPTVEARGHSGQIRISHVAGGQGNGWSAGELRYEYSLDGGHSWEGLSGRTLTGLTNGRTYRVQVRAVGTSGGATYRGPASDASAPVIPYAPPTVTITGSRVGLTQAKFEWSITDNGRAVTTIRSSGADGGITRPITHRGSSVHQARRQGPTQRLCLEAIQQGGQSTRQCASVAMDTIDMRGTLTTQSHGHVSAMMQGVEPSSIKSVTCFDKPPRRGGNSWEAPSTLTGVNPLRMSEVTISCGHDIGSHGSVRIDTDKATLWMGFD